MLTFVSQRSLRAKVSFASVPQREREREGGREGRRKGGREEGVYRCSHIDLDRLNDDLAIAMICIADDRGI